MPFDMAVKEPPHGVVGYPLNDKLAPRGHCHRIFQRRVHEVQSARLAQDVERMAMQVERVVYRSWILEDNADRLTRRITIGSRVASLERRVFYPVQRLRLYLSLWDDHFLNESVSRQATGEERVLVETVKEFVHRSSEGPCPQS